MAEFNFGAANMASIVDILYEGFGKVIECPERCLEDAFMLEKLGTNHEADLPIL